MMVVQYFGDKNIRSKFSPCQITETFHRHRLVGTSVETLERLDNSSPLCFSAKQKSSKMAIQLHFFKNASFQIVLLGDNFVGTNGGAIFVQDIIVDGDVVPDCTMAATFGTIHLTKPIQDRFDRRTSTFQDPIDSLASVQDLDPMHSMPNRRPPSMPHFAAPSSIDSAFAACLKLSCNPTGKKNHFVKIWAY